LFSHHKVLDLFAGTGVGVAVQQLGATEYGVELMPAPLKTREANRMQTVYNDVWDVNLADNLVFDTLWASPPCQTFSMAGHGAGRRALGDVLQVVHTGAYKDITRLRAASDQMGDERIGLVLAPLHYVHRFQPEYVVFEQVPAVLPVWESCAVEMRGMGYSVWVGYLDSVNYGVAQTRKRAYLIAQKNGVATPPAHTARKVISDVLSGTRPHLKAGRQKNKAVRHISEPCFTLAFGNDFASVAWFETLEDAEHWLSPTSDYARTLAELVTLEQVSLLQTYPADFVWCGNKQDVSKQVGNAVPPLLAKTIFETLWR